MSKRSKASDSTKRATEAEVVFVAYTVTWDDDYKRPSSDTKLIGVYRNELKAWKAAITGAAAPRRDESDEYRECLSMAKTRCDACKAKGASLEGRCDLSCDKAGCVCEHCKYEAATEKILGAADMGALKEMYRAWVDLHYDTYGEAECFSVNSNAPEVNVERVEMEVE